MLLYLLLFLSCWAFSCSRLWHVCACFLRACMSTILRFQISTFPHFYISAFLQFYCSAFLQFYIATFLYVYISTVLEKSKRVFLFHYVALGRCCACWWRTGVGNILLITHGEVDPVYNDFCVVLGHACTEGIHSQVAGGSAVMRLEFNFSEPGDASLACRHRTPREHAPKK